jgi:uncharacterized membrane protein YfcA
MSYIAIGLLAGVMSGLFGIGGGIVMTPFLIFAGLLPQQANAVSLAVLMLPVGLPGVLMYRRSGFLNVSAAAWIGLGIIGGMIGGSALAVRISPLLLKCLYSVFLLVVGIRMLRESTPTEGYPRYRDWPGYVLLGVLAGVMGGLFGIGGGLVLIPVLVTMFGFSPRMAAGTSLGALLLPVSLPAVLLYDQAVGIPWHHVPYVAGGFLLGSGIGALITVGASNRVVKRMFGGFLLAVAGYFVLTGVTTVF